MTKSKKLFCFGLGYSATVFALDLMKEGWSVSGTCREPKHLEELRRLGIDAHLFDRDHPLPDLDVQLADTTHLLSSVPPDPQGDAVLDICGNVISRQTGLEWVGYLSTTGVYGNTGGEAVDETAPLNPNPTIKRACRRAKADLAWQKLKETAGLPVHIFRLSGIYGPGRNMLETVKAGKAKRIYKPGHKFSRIHVDDIAQTLRASINRPAPGAIYNLSDDDPAEPADVTAFACDLLGVDQPEPVCFDEAASTMSAMALTFWADNRLIDNSKIKEDLGISLKYPTYASGLRSLLKTINSD